MTDIVETKNELALNDLASLAQYAKAGAALETSHAERISLKAGQLTYREAAAPGNEMKVVVAAAIYQNSYYTEAYDADNPASPTCFAMEAPQGANDSAKEILMRMKPHENSFEPQSDYCHNCQHAKWGSGRKGGKSCKEVRQLALLPADAATSAQAARDAEIVLVKVPVTSVRNWSNYSTRLANAYKLPPFAVVTKLKSIPDPKSQFKLTFEMSEIVGGGNMATINAIRARVEEATAAAMVPPNMKDDAGDDDAPRETVAPVKGSKKFVA